MPHRPERGHQIANLRPKFESLQRAFDAERMEFQTNADGLAPDFVLVIETRGRIEDFYRAAQSIGMGWLGEIDLENLEPDEDFWIADKTTDEPTEKPLDGRLYLGMTNQQAMHELLMLWGRYSDGEDLGRGHTKWRDLFDYAKDIRRWGALDRLHPAVLDAWNEEVHEESVPFRLELWFGPDGGAHEAAVRRAVEDAGGEVLAVARIEDIRFHALKGRLPAAQIRSALAFASSEENNEANLATVFRLNAVRHFLPEAQGVTTSPLESESGPEIDLPPPSELPPVVALLDGYPMAGHQLLDDRLVINDVDGAASSYQLSDMCHGTAMASLILHDELDAGADTLSRPLYCRPILEPDQRAPGREHVPEHAFAEDRVHRAILEMFEGQNPAAPRVCIVNLSLGEEPFYEVLSPWARLVDWLAFKYKILFCISAGNQTDPIDTGMTSAAFEGLSDGEKIDVTLQHIAQTLGARTLRSPGEAINAITVGSLHADYSSSSYLAGRVDMLPTHSLPSPVSRLGPGYRKGIKPEILFRGGRQLYSYQGSNGRYGVASAAIPPGQRVAMPDTQGTGDVTKTTHIRGTSNAAALASRASARLYDVLQSLESRPGGDRINDDTRAPLLKALLVHSASWPDPAETDHILSAVPIPNHRAKRAVARFVGYGIANPTRSEECIDQRATVLGCGVLEQDQAHEYEFPLPPELSGSREWRRLTITLAWLSPVNHQHRAYRQAKLNFSPPAAPLALTRMQGDWQQVQNGTVQHEILEGHAAAAFADGEVLRIKVSAQGDTQQTFDEGVPYGLAVTLEVKEDCDLPIYERIRERLAVPVRAGV